MTIKETGADPDLWVRGATTRPAPAAPRPQPAPRPAPTAPPGRGPEAEAEPGPEAEPAEDDLFLSGWFAPV
ncbi:hypothetical protein ACFWUW_18865 [Streptomyces sp. NPDC058655]|uniref:hypothetical protein n=1 Tax=Streptomyces sp. NPDC058655 TaxID=3346577 RepID=UPI0036485A16